MKNQSLCTLIVALLCVVFTSEVRAQLPNAWQINDNTTSSGYLQYVTNLTFAQVADATNNGWTYTVVSRMVTDNGGPMSQSLAFGNGTYRYYVFVDLDSAGQLTAHLLTDFGTYAITLADAADATNYHTHQIICDPGNNTAHYYFDGVEMSAVAQTSVGQANQVMWGANSSSGRGVMNYHRVEFSINGLGVVASYDAGVAGNPVVAPSPTTQGWTRLASGASLPETPLSPDSVDWPPVVTLAASGVQPHSATVAARLNSDKLAADYYFEYGTTTNYGSFSVTNSVPSGRFVTNVSDVLSNLAPATTYHFRADISNSLGMFTGNDLTFTTLSTAITLPATDVQVTTATLNGLLTLDGLASSWYFEYGLDTNYGDVTPTRLVPAGTNTLAASEPVSGLTLRTTYHFRVVLSNSLGVVTGEDQNFTTAGAIEINSGLGYSTAAWGDYDRDGHLDILETGASTYLQTLLFQNTGSTFTNVNSGLPGFDNSCIAWGDYDNDGLLDVAFIGTDTNGNQVTQIWRNTGTGFTNINAGLPGLYPGSIAWGDYDNDGRLDLLISGTTNGAVTGRITQIWRNTGHGFTNINAGLTGVYNGSAVWGDFDNDGRLDILLAGETNVQNGNVYALTCELWRNAGNGFSNVTDSTLSGATGRDISVADYNGDGLLDFVISGITASQSFLNPLQAVCDVWQNTGSGFTNIQAGLPPMQGFAVWGDYDNDGRPDILLSGYSTNGNYLVEVWRNSPGGFTNFNLGLPLITDSSAWGDYNNDGRLDLLLTGQDPNTSQYVLYIWPNLEPNTNTPPTAPTALASSISNGQVQLNWSPATDAQTPSAGLSYNLRVGTTPGGVDVVSPEAETNGFRLLPASGNAQMRTNAFLENLVPGTAYYWSVQAVDAALAGGPFASEASFVMPGPTLRIVTSNANAVISWQPSYAGVVLQESPSLSPATWTNLPSGATNPAAVPATNETMFYRLFKP